MNKKIYNAGLVEKYLERLNDIICKDNEATVFISKDFLYHIVAFKQNMRVIQTREAGKKLIKLYFLNHSQTNQGNSVAVGVTHDKIRNKRKNF